MDKKVLVFCGGSYVFGAEIVTLSVLDVFKSNGIQVHCIVSGWNNGDFIKRLEQNSISFTVVKLGFFYLSKPLWTFDTLLHYPRAIYKIRQVIKDFKPDFVHHVSYRSIITTYPIVRKLNNYLFVFDAHFGNLNRTYFKILNNVVFLYVSVSDAIRNNLIDIGVDKNRISVIHNGIKLTQNISPTAVYSTIRFGIIGQIIQRKGHKYLVEALKILKEKKLEFELSIIGDGDDMFIEELKEYIIKNKLTKNIKFLKFIADRDIIFKDLDVVLVPSVTSDPLPTSAMEAGFYFKPAIVTNVGGLPEIIVQNKTGVIINPASAVEIASAMERFILFPNLVTEYGTLANEHITQNFNVEKNTLKLIELLKHTE
ncbi:glycosyltransferase involved in cell wall biosynthesis [Pedobacter sp. UYEF25]